MPRSLSVRLRGGLGNQLLQIFAVLAAGVRTGTPVYFVRCAVTEGCRERRTYWDTPLLSGHRADAVSLVPWERGGWPQCTLCAAYESPAAVCPEASYRYDAGLDDHLPPDGPCVLEGYFQSFRYFDAQFETVCATLGLRVADRRPVVGLHVRRDDYVPLADVYALLPLEYYVRALDRSPCHPVLVFAQQDTEGNARDAADMVAALRRRVPHRTFRLVRQAPFDRSPAPVPSTHAFRTTTS